MVVRVLLQQLLHYSKKIQNIGWNINTFFCTGNKERNSTAVNEETEESNNLSVGAIVGIVVAAVIPLIIAIIIGVYYKKIKNYLPCVDRPPAPPPVSYDQNVDNDDTYVNTGQHARFH